MDISILSDIIVRRNGNTTPRGSDVDYLLEWLAESQASLTTIRDAWNLHFKTCTHGIIELPAPSAEDIAAWANAPSNTASADPSSDALVLSSRALTQLVSIAHSLDCNISAALEQVVWEYNQKKE